jgi:outer membrane receptor for ferrienterochelin and colicin
MGRILLAACYLLGATGRLSAGTTGILEGAVRDKRSGEPIPGVNISLPEVQTGASTSSDGSFSIQNIRAGRYLVRFTHVGYQTYVVQNVTINPDLRTRLPIALEPSDLQLEEIVVTQAKPLIQTDVTSTAYMISGEDLRVFPIDRATDIVGYKPGVTMEGNVRGGKTTEVGYLVDGLPVQDVMQGGVTTAVPISTVVGMSVFTGGYEPEYGNALSGIVNIVTRAGGNEPAFTVRAAKDNLFGGTQNSKTSEIELFAAGPIIRDKLFYVGSVEGDFTGTRWWQDLAPFFDRTIDKTINAFGKLDYNVSPKLKVGLQMLFSDHDWRDYEFNWRYNLNGLPPERRQSARVALILSHTVTDNFYYTTSLSRYHTRATIGDGGRESVPVDDPYQYDFFLRYVVAGQRALWLQNTQDVTTVKFDGILQAAPEHLMKFGAEFTLYNLSSDIVKLEPRMTYFGKPMVNEPQLDFSSQYTYRPSAGGLYVQDKVDLLSEGVLLTYGLRYDFLDPRASRPALETTLSGDTVTFTPGKTVKASFKQQFSPRIGAAMPILENGYVFFNLGWYFQYPLFDYLYTGIDRVALAKGISAVTGNPDLEPERSTAWEIALKCSFPLNLVGSLTYFRKETTNLVDTKTFVPGDSKVAGTYGFSEFVNNPYASSSGVEIVLSRDRGEWVTGELSYTFLNAEGTSGSAMDGYYIAQYGLPPGRRIFPLSWDQRHTVKLRVSLNMPGELNLNVFTHWHTGRPYTYYPTSTGFEQINGGTFVQNNDRMPSYFNIDVRCEKSFRFDGWPDAVLTVYIDGRNLTNQKNIAWMDSNGRIGGELGDPSGYFIGRRIKLGIQLSF